MKKPHGTLCWGLVTALPLVFAASLTLAAPKKTNNGVSPPDRPQGLSEVVRMRDEVRVAKESVRSKKRNEKRPERGLRSKNPKLTAGRIVVIPGEFINAGKEHVTPPLKPSKPGKPDNPGKPSQP